ncbi:metalloendoproteinase 1-MMP [Cucumis melo var. makuwa]|uniref:Metalloendoproteinase 1-MMP n=1 Tax=Cucumis melo var. makuwa TaxID=1194695 RepID=A0A5A7TDJ4_CUCMM|nr:metalloendoproteinase 1-MMP [Cucumis melo var. makuwa]
MFPFFRYYPSFFIFFLFFNFLSSSVFLFSPVFPARTFPDNNNQDYYAWRNFARFLDAGKGTEVSGMSELKKYLNRFGYLPIPPQNNFSDIFDDQFVSALSLYQNRLGLSVTGKLDSETIASIMSPRCGISDLTKINNNGSTIHSTRRYAFFNGQPRWIRSSTLTYALSPDYTIDYLTSSEIRKVVRRSFSRWSAVIPLNFTESSDYDSSDIRIGFYRGDHGDGEAFDGVLGVLAHAFSPENGRLHLDAAERWAVDFEKEKSKVAVDLESVVTHEIGHVLGLAHSTVKESVMYPSLSPRGKKVDLRIDDVEGIQVLYGTNPNFKLESFLESEKSMNSNGSSSSSSNSNSNLLFLLFFYFLIMIW